MIDDPITVGFGLGVSIAGILLYAWGAKKPDFVPANDEERDEFDFLTRQSRRRGRVGVGFVICGLLLIASGVIDASANLRNARISNLLALSSLPIITWAILVALGDWAIAHRRSTRELRSVQSQREQMEQVVANYRSRSDR